MSQNTKIKHSRSYAIETIQYAIETRKKKDIYSAPMKWCIAFRSRSPMV